MNSPNVSTAEKETASEPHLRQGIDRLLQHAVHATNCPDRLSERRNERRYPYPNPIRLLPVDRSGLTVIGEEIVAVGKHISDRGFDFYFNEPVPYRRMIATLPTSAFDDISFLVDLEWCRFGDHGLYVNVAKFVGIVDLPSN